MNEMSDKFVCDLLNAVFSILNFSRILILRFIGMTHNMSFQIRDLAKLLAHIKQLYGFSPL